MPRAANKFPASKAKRLRILLKHFQCALKSSKHPVGVAEYKITKKLTKKYQAELPKPKELKEQLIKVERQQKK